MSDGCLGALGLPVATLEHTLYSKASALLRAGAAAGQQGRSHGSTTSGKHQPRPFPGLRRAPYQHQAAQALCACMVTEEPECSGSHRNPVLRLPSVETCDVFGGNDTSEEV